MLIRIRNLITTIWYQLTSRHYRLMKKSGLIDPGYYFDRNPDIAAAGVDPIIHYLTRGFAEKRRPGPLFDQEFYCYQVPELDEKAENPLVHFLEKGRYQGLRPNLLVDPEYYARVNPDFNPETTDPLSWFLQAGSNGSPAQSPSPYFDPPFYCSRHSDAGQFLNAPKAAYEHFLSVGVEENRQPGPYFDSAYYLDKNPMLREIGLDAISHYCKFGAAKRRSPCPLFDPNFYADSNGITDCDDLFAHFLSGMNEDRQPCSWFDPVFYRKTYLSKVDDQIAPLRHYLENGLKNKYYPNEEVAHLAGKPVISILVPVYNVELSYLNNCIRSVLYQSYPHWQLCLVDDCSTVSSIRPLLEEWAACDPRIRVNFLAQNGGISAATNAAAKLATGSYMAFLDNDDELAPEALQTFAMWISRNPADLYYSDEMLIGEDGRQLSVFRKPGFNRELLLSHNYVTHCVLTKKTLYDRVGGCVEDLDGAQDLDLFLKLSEEAETTIHIPQGLYYWRASATSTSINHDEKHYADEAGRKCVLNALARRGEAAESLFTELKFFYRAKRLITNELPVTLVVKWDRHGDDIIEWLTRHLTTSGHRVSQLIIVMTRQPAVSLAESISAATGIDTTCTVTDKGLAAAAQCQSVLTDVKGFFVAVLNGDLCIESDHWLAALVEYGQSAEFGIIGGRIDYPAEYYDVVSSIPDCSQASPVYYNHFITNCSVFMNGRHCQQQVLAVNSDLFLMRNELLTSQKGLNVNDFPYLFTVTDLCFRLHKGGWKNIYTPYCQATTNVNHLTRVTKRPLAAMQEEKTRFQNTWNDILDLGDPFYNPGVISDKDLSVDGYRAWLKGSCPS